MTFLPSLLTEKEPDPRPRASAFLVPRLTEASGSLSTFHRAVIRSSTFLCSQGPVQFSLAVTSVIYLKGQGPL